jgi:8-amino-7-oxononanoate synthase
LATALEGLRVNRERGDELRLRVHRMSRRVLDGLAELGIVTPNTSGYPIIEVPLHDPDDIDEVGRYLFDHGIYATMAAYPLVPKHEVGFRLQVTASNTDEQVSHLLLTLNGLAERFQMRPAAHATLARHTG